MSLRDAAGCCLDNILVVHYVCMVLVSVGENEHRKKKKYRHIYINIATDLYCIEKKQCSDFDFVLCACLSRHTVYFKIKHNILFYIGVIITEFCIVLTQCLMMLKFPSNPQSHNKGAVTLQTFQELIHLK